MRNEQKVPSKSVTTVCTLLHPADLPTPVDPDDPLTWPKPEFSGSAAFTVFMVVLMGAFSLGQVIPNTTALLKVGTADDGYYTLTCPSTAGAAFVLVSDLNRDINCRTGRLL